MNYKIKIGFIIVFLILLFIFIKIRKVERINNKNLFKINKKIELFQGSAESNLCSINNINTEQNSLECFRNSFFNFLAVENIDDTLPDPIIVNNNNNSYNKIFSACFDEINDDIIVLDYNRLRRFQFRPIRNYTPTFKIQPIKVDQNDDIAKNLYIKYCKELHKKFSPDFNFSGEAENAFDTSSYNYMIDFHNNYLIKFLEIESSKNNDTEIIIEIGKTHSTNSLKEEKAPNLPINITFLKFTDLIKDLNEKFYSFYNHKLSCSQYNDSLDESCQITYQREFPPFKISDTKFGITNLEFDNENNTFRDSESIDININKDNNVWKNPKYNGVIKQIEFDEELEYDSIPELDSKFYFTLPKKLNDIGVGIYKNGLNDVVKNILLVPDTYNNRIQIFETRERDFLYLNQFGNLDTTPSRALPIYKVPDNDIAKLGLFYEPLIDIEEYRDYQLHNMRSIYSEPKSKCIIPTNPFNASLIIKGEHIDDNYLFKDYCKNEFRSIHMDVHSRNILENVDKGNSITNDERLKVGYFNFLLSEYTRVHKYDKLDEFNLGNYNQSNYIGYELNEDNKTIYSNAVKEATLLYRKILYKNIKITNEGHKFGQLFRPKSIAFDNIHYKYYVVDTYHHCIQCFDYYSYECADKEFNDNPICLYKQDEETLKISLVDDSNDYNNSDMYSLGVRLEVLNNPAKTESAGYEDWKDYISTEEGKLWASKAGQTDTNGNPIVRLIRWISGMTKNEFKPENLSEYEGNSIFPQFYSEIVDDPTKPPGLGEFLYPSDIVIFEDKLSEKIFEGNGKNQFMMVTDMGNDRVSIFRKIILADGKFRFRFYRFLNEGTENNNLFAPLSITVNKNLGIVYILHYTESGLTNKQITVYTPMLEEEVNGKINLKYKPVYYFEAVPITTVKIRIDDRGFIVLSNKDNGFSILNNNNKIKFNSIAEQDDDTSQLSDIFSVEKHKVGLNTIVIPIKIRKEVLQDVDLKNKIYNLPDQLNRFRILLQRFNLSKGKEEPIYKMSHEFLFNYLIDSSDLDSIKLNFNDMNLSYKIIDAYNIKNPNNYWSTKDLLGDSKLDVDVENIQKIKPEEKDIFINAGSDYPNDNTNFDIYKNYRDEVYNIFNLENKKKYKVLYNYEDWQGAGIKANTTYLYLVNQYNYTGISKMSTGNIKITTIPYNVDTDFIDREYNFNNKNINFKISYASISELYNDTQRYNPLYAFVLKKKHYRTKDGNTRHITLKKNQYIQLFIPKNSKIIYNIKSKPKFGKLLVYDIYKLGSVMEQNKIFNNRNPLCVSNNNDESCFQYEEIEIGKDYSNSRYIIFYALVGGNVNEGGIPLSGLDLINGDFGLDYFIFGDNSKSVFKKIKYNVFIDLKSDKVNDYDNDQIILFDKPGNVSNNLKQNYSKPDNMDNIYLTEFVKKIPLFKLTGDSKKFKYPETILFEDGNIEENMTYEYFILIGNQEVINPANNSFYFTTPPPKPLLEPIVDERLGPSKDNYLKIEWYTPKNENIYWSYNFLLLRRLKKSREFLKEIDKRKGIIKTPNMLNSNGFYESSTTGIYEHEFTVEGEPRDWNLYFNIYSSKRHTFEYSLVINNVKAKKKFTFNNNKPPFQDKNLKNQIPLMSSLTLKINLKKGDILNNIRIEETVIPKDKIIDFAEKNGISVNLNILEKQQESRYLRKINLDKKKDRLNKLMADELIRQKEKARDESEIGKMFLLDDDFIEGENNLFKGYTGNLYLYLKEKNNDDLHKIFDTLHDKILIYYGDITMKFDGPSGMLKSGNRDVLIDKIRYMALLYKEGYKSVLDYLNLVVVSGNGLDGTIKLKTKSLVDKLMEEEQKIDKEKEQMTKKIEQHNKEIETLKEQLKKEELSQVNRDDEIEDINDKIKLLEEENMDIIEKIKEKDSEKDEIDVNEDFMMEDKIDIKNKYINSDGTFKFETLGLTNNNDRIFIGKKYNGEIGSLLENNDGGFELEYSSLDESFTTLDMLLKSGKSSSINNIYSNTSHIILQKEGTGVKLQYAFNKTDNDIIENLVPSEENDTMKVIIISRQKNDEEEEIKLNKIQAENEEKIQELNAIKEGIEAENNAAKEEIQKKIAEIRQKLDLQLSEWSVIKYGLPEEIIKKYPTKEEIRNLIENYGIVPTLNKLSDSIKDGLYFNKDENKSYEEKELLKQKKYLCHKQLIKLGDVDAKMYEYCVLTYHSGYNFNSEEKRSYMGLQYLSRNNDQMLNCMDEKFHSSEFNFPNLNLGEIYSDILEKGQNIKNQEIIPPQKPIVQKIEIPKVEHPEIIRFLPKQGLQGSIVKIIGKNLNKIKYFCFRDIKVKIIRKGHILEKEGETNYKYDEYLVRVPTLKELGKECWQSLRPYEVLVWGYYEGEGKQIRSSEEKKYIKGNESNEFKKKILMFRYLDRTVCPENEKLELPK